MIVKGQGSLRPFFSELYVVIVERKGKAEVHSEWNSPQAANAALDLLWAESLGRFPMYIDKVVTERYTK
jgi:hypothetical protein